MPVCAEARGPWQCLSVASLCILRSVHFYLMCVDVLSPCMALHYVCLVPQGTRRGPLELELQMVMTAMYVLGI